MSQILNVVRKPSDNLMNKTYRTRTTRFTRPLIEVVLLADSEELARNSSLPSDSLIEVGTEHRLADEESLRKMLEACKGEC